MSYKSVNLENTLSIENVFTIHYFEYMSDFSFAGESHDFWEFVFVDKGEIDIYMDNIHTRLKKREIAFHKPNEFHRLQATGSSAPNLVVISFSCNSPAMDFFKEKILTVDDLGKALLGDIIKEAKQLFDCRLDDPYLTEMTKKEDKPIGAEQLIRIELEHFLLHLLRCSQNTNSPAFPKTTGSKGSSEIFNRVLDYMESHLECRLTIDQLCKENMVGRSQLQKIFQQKTGLGVIEYFSHMKIDAAKQMMRTDFMNFTQISESLGYSSIHYFSRQFKKITGMTPSEYVSSVKALAEN